MIGFHAAALLLLFPFQGESKTDYFQLKTQQQLAGEILSVDDDSVTLKISLYGGTAEVTRKLKDFTPESAFRIVSSQAKDTYEDHLRLAREAEKLGALPFIRQELKAAFQVAEKANNETQQNEVKKIAADTAEKYFSVALQKNDLPNAKKLLNVILVKLPDERTDAQKKALLEAYEAAEGRVQSDMKAERAEKAEQAKIDEAERVIDPIKKKIVEAQQLNREGLLAGGKNVGARNKFDQALQMAKSAYQQLKPQEKSSNKLIKDQYSSLVTQIFEVGKDACINAASTSLIQTDYNKAREYVNLVLSVDPKNEEALDMRGRIEMASTTRWWW
jgi:hypothetical protein